MLDRVYLAALCNRSGTTESLQMGIDARQQQRDQLLSLQEINEVLHDLILDGIFGELEAF